jgi:NADH-quinone oxidoreductase subunit N
VAANFEPNMLLAILPQICLVVLAGLVLLLDLVWHDDQCRNLGWVTAFGLFLIGITALVFSRPGNEPTLILGGMLRQDWLSFVFLLVFLFGAAITALFAMDIEIIGRRGEFYVLMLAATLGMTLMASAADLIMIYLAIETTSIPLYVLAGFLFKDNKSTEAGFKYLLFGAMTSAVMLYGFSLLYGFSGTTQIYALAGQLEAGQLPLFVIVGLLILILFGFGFKISAVPFHFWAPDVYEGSPTPVAGFLSTASKAAGFAVLMRVLMAAFPAASMPSWGLVLAIISTATMFLGNGLALAQKNIKRMLAYSSIAQAGYILVGLAAVSSLGFSGSTFYLISYLVTNLAAFGVVAIVGRAIGSDEISAYAGLSRRAPGLTLILLISLLSLGGIPPFSGFAGKVFVFAAAIEKNLVWLAVLGIINSMIGLYYYLIVLKVAYLYRSENETQPLKLSRPWSLALALCVVGILLMGTIFAPWWNWASQAVASLF